jgi:protein SCO1
MSKDRYCLPLTAVFVCMLLTGAARSLGAQQDKPPEVGIYERLGAQAALDVTLRNETGENTTLRELIEKPTILTLNYFHCPGICTPMLNGLVDVINTTQLEPGRDFQIVTLSFDPRDTPAVARKERSDYLRQIKRPFAPKAWRFLTGEAQATKQVADSVGFYFHAEGGMFNHPGAIMILTPTGIVSRYIHGTVFLPADIEIAIQDARGGQVRPTISKVLSFCYSYEPGSRQYVLQTTRVVGGVFLICAGGFVVYLLKGKSRSGKERTRLSA